MCIKIAVRSILARVAWCQQYAFFPVLAAFSIKSRAIWRSLLARALCVHQAQTHQAEFPATFSYQASAHGSLLQQDLANSSHSPTQIDTLPLWHV